MYHVIIILWPQEAKQLRKITKFSEEGLENVARKMAEE